MLLVQIHILVYQMKQIVTITPGGISQINYRYLIPIMLFGDGSIISHDIALGVG